MNGRRGGWQEITINITICFIGYLLFLRQTRKTAQPQIEEEEHFKKEEAKTDALLIKQYIYSLRETCRSQRQPNPFSLTPICPSTTTTTTNQTGEPQQSNRIASHRIDIFRLFCPFILLSPSHPPLSLCLQRLLSWTRDFQASSSWLQPKLASRALW